MVNGWESVLKNKNEIVDLNALNDIIAILFITTFYENTALGL